MLLRCPRGLLPIALWCLPCLARFMLHVSTHEATEYSLFSVDGTKTFDPTSCALKRRGARVEWCATPQAA